jgi:hypothetical protein
LSWTGPRELREELQRLWERGELLAEMVRGESAFPRRMRFRGPSSAELSERFEDVRAWIAELRSLARVRIQMREIRHRILGANQVPAAIWVDSLDDALAMVGKRPEAARFAALAAATRAHRPELLEWLARKPHEALELADAWERLLEVVAWIEAHPRPGLYLRQVDIPGVDSKFIEAHRGVLSQWLDRVLPPEAVDGGARGAGAFARRYGFRSKPERVRLRALDPQHALLAGLGDADLTLDTVSFARLDPGVSQVFITENEVNFLAFPQVKDSLVVFGAGYGFGALADAAWLGRCRVFYWGDIDTHGFAILDQLRAHLPRTRSILMDRATLFAFEAHWGVEEKPTRRDLPRLDAAERELYDALRDDRIRPGLRLEQERIGFGWVQRAVAGLGGRTD